MNAPNSPYRPLLTDAARPATFEVAAVDENGESRAIAIAGVWKRRADRYSEIRSASTLRLPKVEMSYIGG